MKIVWLSTTTATLACHSLKNACAQGAPGDLIHQHDREADAMASRASHRIVSTRTGKKRLVRITP
jgi:hypothetical protein